MPMKPMRARGVSLAVALAIVVAGLSVWATGRRASRGAAPEGDVRRLDPAANTAPPADAPGGVGLARKPAPAATPAAPQPVPTASENEDVPLAPADGPVHLKVRFVGEGPPPSRLEVLAYPERDNARVVRLVIAAPVREGRLPRAERYFLETWLDGWRSDQWSDVSVPENLELALDVRLPTRPVLAVVDAITDRPVDSPTAMSLEGIESIRDERRAAPPWVEDRRTVVPGDAEGRITLPRTASGSGWWVGAPGRAWARVAVPYEQATTRVPLAPGGGIRVEVEGFADLDGPRVVATQASPPGDDAAEQELVQPGKRGPGAGLRDVDMRPDDAPGRFVLDGLPPGPWKVLVGRRGPYFLQEVWGEVAVEVVAGRRAEVRLRPERAKKQVRVDVDVELVVPAEWAGDTFQVSLLGCGTGTDGTEREWKVAPEVRGTVRTHLASLPPGPYQLSVYPLDWSCLVRVKAPAESLHVDLPPPARVRVRVLDEDGKPTVRGASVRVHYPSPLDDWREEASVREPSEVAPEAEDQEGPTGWSGGEEDIPADPTGQGFAGRVASGRVAMVAEAPGRVETRVFVTLLPGAEAREVEIRLPRGAGLELRILRDGNVATDVEAEMTIGPEEPDEDGGTWSKGFGVARGVGRIDGLAAGAYVVRWARGDGKEALLKHVVIHAGETSQVEFEVK